MTGTRLRRDSRQCGTNRTERALPSWNSDAGLSAGSYVPIIDPDAGPWCRCLAVSSLWSNCTSAARRWRPSMQSTRTVRGVLLLDATGCAATAGLLTLTPSALRPVDPSLTSRWPIVAALVATSAACACGARSTSPTRGDMRVAALLNSGWVIACLITLARDRDRTGTALVATTAVLDASMGVAQWALSHAAVVP